MSNSTANSESDNTNNSTDKKFAISVSPNPASNTITLKFQNSSKGVVALNFANMSGSTVKSLKYNLQDETSLVEIPIGDLLPGIYIINAKQNDKAGNVKLIVK